MSTFTLDVNRNIQHLKVKSFCQCFATNKNNLLVDLNMLRSLWSKEINQNLCVLKSNLDSSREILDLVGD